MMKTRYNIVLLGAALMCGACAEDVFVENMPSNEALTITISTEPISRDTRAVEHIGYTDDVVEQNLNENRIRTVDIYMFSKPDISDEDQISYHLPRITVSDEGDGEMGIETISLMINNAVFEAALGGLTPDQAITQNKRYYASIIVNQPSDITVEAGQTFAQLKEKTTSCAQFASGEVVPTFVMTGNATLAVRHDNDANCYVLYNPVAGYITVERCAAKIDLVVDDVQEYIRDEYGNFWKSVPSTLKASFYHGVKKTSLAADLSYEPVMPPTNPHDYFDVTPSRSFVQATADNRPMFDAGDYYTVSDGKHMPYYSYPSLWDGNDFDKKKEAYFLLQMDWQEIKGRTKVDDVTVTAETEGAEAAIDSNGNTIYFINDGNADTEPVLTSYQLPITSSFLTNANRFIRNNYYRLCVKVGIIGSFDPGNPEEIINNTYIVADWSKESINMNLHEAAYLTVNEHEKKLSNQNSGFVTYSSSPKAKAEVVWVEFYDFSYESGNTYGSARSVDIRNVHIGKTNAVADSWYTVGTSTTHNALRANTNRITYYEIPYYLNYNKPSYRTAIRLSDFQLNVDNNGYLTDDSKIILTHTLNNQTMFTPFTVYVRVWNESTGTEEFVTFTQYPQNYIEGHRSNGKVFVNHYDYYSAIGYNNTVYDDRYSYYNYNNDPYRLGSIADPNGTFNGTGTNTNPNIYVIYTTSLSDNTYTIGDPRDAPQKMDAYLSPAQYRPVKQEGTEDIISPAFAIASSYGKTNYSYMTFDMARKRCEAYQEDGYPAGRWRLPTAAELIYIAQLATNGQIPSLFNFTANDDTGYWSGNGKVISQNSVLKLATGNNRWSGYTAPRCVYDIWYWGDEHSTYANQFHYGDADPRQ